jgi:two-component system NarL family response regulator
MIKVLIADDHHLFREGLARIIRDAPGMELVGSAEDGEEAVQLTREHKPDVVLLDVNMPGLSGLDAACQIHENNPQVQILMLTISEKDRDLFTAIRSGARGYLLKNASTQDLLGAIRQVCAGQSPVTPSMAAKLLDEFTTLSSNVIPGVEKRKEIEKLTDREQEVLRLVARGMSNKEIGEELGISPLTAKAHLSSILEKLRLRGRVEAAAWAIRHGLVPGVHP